MGTYQIAPSAEDIGSNDIGPNRPRRCVIGERDGSGPYRRGEGGVSKAEKGAGHRTDAMRGVSQRTYQVLESEILWRNR